MEWRVEIWDEQKEYHLYVDGIHRAAAYHSKSNRRGTQWWVVLYDPIDGLSRGGIHRRTLAAAKEWCEKEAGR